MNVLITPILTLFMSYTLPPLPYAPDALEPVISEATMNLHHGKHLQTYVNNLNALVPGSPYEGMTVEEIVIAAPEGSLCNNAGQVLNHTLYFGQFTPKPLHKEPTGRLAEAIRRDFGNFENFRNEMNAAATGLFGSGWTWLVMDDHGKLLVLTEANGGNPLRRGFTPLLGFDVWEHAYYLDYQNRRTDHLARLWDIIDWEAVEGRM